MKIGKFIINAIGRVCTFFLIVFLSLGLYLPRANYGFHIETESVTERLSLLDVAVSHLDTMEGSDDHKSIIDTYNAHDPLAQGYEVQYDDDWCATFVSFAAIKADLTSKIPTECSCQRQIDLWKELGCWEEEDTYLPLPGDIIYYDWDVRTMGDSVGWSDHVGIVVGTHGPFIKVIEGNKDDSVEYRYIIRWDPRIRGYGLPNYG